MRFAVDTGGTFTDLVVADAEGSLGFYKTPTTASDRVQGVLTSFRLAAYNLGFSLSELPGRGELLVPGTTTATNAIVIDPGSSVRRSDSGGLRIRVGPVAR